jgi:hypothetical protein
MAGKIPLDIALRAADDSRSAGLTVDSAADRSLQG